MGSALILTGDEIVTGGSKIPPQNESGGGVERKLIGSEVKELGSFMLNIPCPQSNDEEKE